MEPGGGETSLTAGLNSQILYSSLLSLDRDVTSGITSGNQSSSHDFKFKPLVGGHVVINLIVPVYEIKSQCRRLQTGKYFVTCSFNEN